VGDFIQVFEADDGEVRGGEAVLEGVIGGAGFAFGSLGSGGVSGVGAVGGELFGRDYFGQRLRDTGRSGMLSVDPVHTLSASGLTA
jgi:hypothetical protein